MALYWPTCNLALEIVDDPVSAPVDRTAYPAIKVIQTTRAEINDPRALDRLTRRLAREMDRSWPAASSSSASARHELMRYLENVFRTSGTIRAREVGDTIELLPSDKRDDDREETGGADPRARV